MAEGSDAAAWASRRGGCEVREGRGRATPAAVAGMRRALTDVGVFGAAILGMPLREYQLQIARAVLDSVAARRGLQLTVLMPRQGGKNQLSAHLEAFLLARYQWAGGSLVKRINSPLMPLPPGPLRPGSAVARPSPSR